MDENEILVQCIGEMTVDCLGRENIARLTVELLPGLGEARILVAPTADDMDAHLALLSKFAHVEDAFEDEASLSIRLVPSTAPDFDLISSRELAYSA